MTGALARGALVVVALVAIAWLAHGVRALDLADDGNAKAAAAGQPPDPVAAEDALSAFRAASRWNPDPAPTLDEATLLLSLGRAREAARVLEDVTRVNRGNVQAWSLLAVAAAQFDPRRADAATGELTRLYGRIAAGSAPPSALLIRDGQLYRVVPKTGQGVVDFSRVTSSEITVGGWAADLRARRRTELVLVASNGRVIAATRPSRPRPDLARRYGPALARSGFRIAFPHRRAQDALGQLDVQVFAVSGDEASRLRFFCPSAHQDLGC